MCSDLTNGNNSCEAFETPFNQSHFGQVASGEATQRVAKAVWKLDDKE